MEIFEVHNFELLINYKMFSQYALFIVNLIF